MARCNHCGAFIHWHRTKAGRSVCLDQKVNPRGSWTVIEDNIAVYLGPDSDCKLKRFTLHWATCTAKRKAKPKRQPQPSLFDGPSEGPYQ